MIGIFDSGLGGLAVLRRVRELNKSANLVFYADLKNAPYGTKSPHELIRLVKNDVRILKRAGASRILIGCCTASTVYSSLSELEREICVPIIAPTARAAVRESKNGRIGVIGTRATVASRAFSREISKISDCEVYEKEAQELVALVESGECDGRLSRGARDKLYGILKPLREKNIDTVVLGCTHFDWLLRSIEECLPNVRAVSSPRAGAYAILNELEKEKGSAETYYIR